MATIKNIFLNISQLLLGETSTTAYRGDRGKEAYDHSQLTSGNPHNVDANDVGLGNVANTDLTAEVNANTAKTSYTDGADVTANTAARHSHINKALLDAYDNSNADITSAISHISDTNNPHQVTKAQVGLSNVPNTDFTSQVSANSAKNSYTDAIKVAGIESGAQKNVQTDWEQSSNTEDDYLKNKPAQINFNIYNQNKKDKVTLNTTTKTSIIKATTGTKGLPSYALNDSFIGRLFGSFNPSGVARDIQVFFQIGNREYSTILNTEASSAPVAFEIEYTINFPINREANISGVIRCGNASQIIDLDFPIITGFEFEINSTLNGGALVVNSSLLHRNFN